MQPRPSSDSPIPSIGLSVTNIAVSILVCFVCPTVAIMIFFPESVTPFLALLSVAFVSPLLIGRASYPVFKVLFFLIPIVISALFLPSLYLLTLGMLSLLLAIGIKFWPHDPVALEARLCDLAIKCLNSIIPYLKALLFAGVAAFIFPITYFVIFVSVVWLITAHTPIVVIFYMVRAMALVAMYFIPDSVYTCLFCDSRVVPWVSKRLRQRRDGVSDLELAELVSDAMRLFSSQFFTPAPLTQKIARNIARRKKRKMELFRRFPIWWELFRYALPKKAEREVFDNTYNDLMADYLRAGQHFKHPGRKRWLTFCFGLRTVLMFLECLRTFVQDRTIGHLSRLAPRFVARLWKSFVID